MSRILLLALSFLAVLPSLRAIDETIPEGAVVVVPVDGAITRAEFYFLRRILKAAEADKAAALVLDMNTPGGELKATEDIVQALIKSKVPTYTYVNTNAGSAGALIALGTKAVYMAPVSAIGAAAPVMGGGQEVPETMNAKMVSYYSGYFRSVAETNGYNPNLVDAFMNLNKEVKIGETVLNPEGAILTLSAQEAVKEYDGKPLLARGIAPTIEDVCLQAGLDPARMVKIGPSGFERMAQLITALAPLFLLGGMIGAYMEFKAPGFGVAGILSAVCFLLFFAGHYVAGLTGFEVVAVFGLGVLLILLELIFFPGVLVLAALGTALMVGSLFFAMVDYYPTQPLDLNYTLLAGPMINLTIALLLFVIAAAVLARIFPSLPLFKRLVLASQSPTGPSLEMAAPAFRGRSVQVGEEGIAVTILRPAGRGEFQGAPVDVVADGEFIEAGSRIRVIRFEGGGAVVSAVL